MKPVLESLLKKTCETLKTQGVIPKDIEPRVQIDRSRDKSHGDFATNLAMLLAKPAGKKPRELAQSIVDNLPENPNITKIEIAGPGFINFFISTSSQYAVIGQILEESNQYGRSQEGVGQRVQVEFVSANPTGPLHVGHGRGAAYGATIANLLEAVGYDVQREYYVNDAGRQMDILATSVYLRYLEANGETPVFPSNGYQGEYIKDIAANIHRSHGDALTVPAANLFNGVPADAPKGGDKETHIDGLINNTKALLGDDNYRIIFKNALTAILGDIKEDLKEFGIEYQNWFSERSLTENGSIEKAVSILKEAGYLYLNNDAWWFKSTAFGDDKDRVVIRDNGQPTYFASDIAYHLNKFERGFNSVINVWGADHHGYISRIMASLKALNLDPNNLKVLLVQFANLYRGTEKLQMSTRSGSFVTLRELREEVGNDAARFFYVTRKSEQHMDFDLDLAKSQSSDNPVYYVQYAHARICSVFKQLLEKDIAVDLENSDFGLLTEERELELLRELSRYPEVVEMAARSYEPHLVAYYVRDLANEFHTYYNAHPFIASDAPLRNARLSLIDATRVVLANALSLLGVSAPSSM